MSEGDGVGPSWPADLDLTPAQEIVVRVIAIAKAHGYADGPVQAFFGWLEDRLALAERARLERAKESELEPLGIYGASRVDERPPGKFVSGLRNAQARSASMAMVLMADDLQWAYEEIGRLKGLLAERKGLEP